MNTVNDGNGLHEAVSLEQVNIIHQNIWSIGFTPRWNYYTFRININLSSKMTDDHNSAYHATVPTPDYWTVSLLY